MDWKKVSESVLFLFEDLMLFASLLIAWIMIFLLSLDYESNHLLEIKYADELVAVWLILSIVGNPLFSRIGFSKTPEAFERSIFFSFISPNGLCSMGKTGCSCSFFFGTGSGTSSNRGWTKISESYRGLIIAFGSLERI